MTMRTRKTELAGAVAALVGIAVGALVAGAVQGHTEAAGGIRFLSSQSDAALELPLAVLPESPELQVADIAPVADAGSR
jgi:hypothetical protein